jgi:hypothetical protein
MSLCLQVSLAAERIVRIACASSLKQWSERSVSRLHFYHLVDHCEA